VHSYSIFLLGLLPYSFISGRNRQRTNYLRQPASEREESRELTENAMPLGKILLLAFVCGSIALSYEILWMRIFSFANAGAAFIFPRILGLFLLGLALGAYTAGRVCERFKIDTL
jgi:hypothetical protein